MLQLENKTPFAADIAIFPNEKGVDTLYTVVKASFTIGKEWTLADDQLAPIKVDEYWGEPGKSSLKNASDFHIGKESTDIIISGSAYAPKQQPVKQLDVAVSVGDLKKKIRIFGNRIWCENGISEPEAFTTMPIVYERAYGGSVFDESGEVVDADPLNPVGIGFLPRGEARYAIGAPLPNIEDPNDLICDAKSKPKPVGYSAVSPYWRSRSQWAGTYDEAWQTTRAPYLPLDFDKRFLNVAHPDLICPDYLLGGERVHITNMHEKGDMEFQLPVVKLNGKADLQGSQIELPFNLETILLNPNKLQASLIWRAKCEADKSVRKISSISVSLSR